MRFCNCQLCGSLLREGSCLQVCKWMWFFGKTSKETLCWICSKRTVSGVAFSEPSKTTTNQPKWTFQCLLFHVFFYNGSNEVTHWLELRGGLYLPNRTPMKSFEHHSGSQSCDQKVVFSSIPLQRLDSNYQGFYLEETCSTHFSLFPYNRSHLSILLLYTDLKISFGSNGQIFVPLVHLKTFKLC